MVKRLIPVALFLGLAALLFALGRLGCVSPGRGAGRRTTPVDVGAVRVMAYYVPGVGETPETVGRRLRRLDTLITFWYSLAPDGSLIGDAEPELIRAVRRSGKRLAAMVNNLGGNDAALRDPAIRRRAVTNIAQMVEIQGLDGVNIDFQLVPPERREGYTRFVDALSQALKPLRKSLELSVFPPTEVPYQLNGVYDYRAIGKIADRVVIMTYDRHNPVSAPGPIAPIDWVERNIQSAINMIPRRKVFLGVALYGYDWPVTTGLRAADIGAAAALQLAGEVGAGVRWDRAAQVPNFRYYDRYGRRHDVWFESAEASLQKFRLASRYRIGGVALWRLGFEEPKFWRLVR